MNNHHVRRSRPPSPALPRNTGRGSKFFAGLGLLACVACANAADDLPPDLQKRLEAVDAKVAAIKDLTAKFEQKKFSPLLKNPITTRGQIRVLGDAMLWLTDAPDVTQLRIDSKQLQLLYVGQKSLEVYPLKGKLASLASSPIPRLAALRARFKIAPDPDPRPESGSASLALVLTPVDPDLKPYIDTVKVRLDETTGVVQQFDLIDPDGERTEITFTDPKPNTGLTAKDLDLTPPPGTKTTHPLDTQTP